MNLVDYGDSDSENEQDLISQTNPQSSSSGGCGRVKRSGLEVLKQPPAKRLKKLPKLGDTFRTVPVDDPLDHQGRERARPWVWGEYTAHVYIELKPSKQLRQALDDAIAHAQRILGETYPHHPLKIHSILNPSPSSSPTTSAPHTHPPAPTSSANPSSSSHSKLSSVLNNLHISLTHPLPLRQDQIPLFHAHLDKATQAYRARNSRGQGMRLAFGREIVGYMNGSDGDGVGSLRDGKAKDEHSVARMAAGPGAPGAGAGWEEEGDTFSESGFEAHTSGGAIGNKRKRGPLENMGKTGTGRRNRAFIASRITTGHDQLERLQSTVIDPFLDIHHLPRYHSNPEFHASFAWSLLLPHQSSSSSSSPSSTAPQSPAFGGTTPFTPQILRRINDAFAQKIGDVMPKGGWEVDGFEVKVGKDVRRFRVA